MASQKARNVMKKKVNRGHKEFQDLVDEMVIDLVQQDMEKNGTEARKKAEEEHKVCLAITESKFLARIGITTINDGAMAIFSLNVRSCQGSKQCG